MTRVVIYARYSAENQRDTSIAVSCIDWSAQRPQNSRHFRVTRGRPMRSLCLWVAVSTLAVYGCGDERRLSPTAPTSMLPTLPVVPPQPPPPSPDPGRLDIGTPIEFGQTFTFTVTNDDPVCGGAYLFHCRYFRLTVPNDGVLVVSIRWKIPASYPFDMSVFGPSGAIADGQIGVGLERIARGRVRSGTTYAIEVWSFLTTPEPFELSTSLE
jgi:hypothetical protein